MDIGEADAAEAGALEDARGGGAVGERERGFGLAGDGGWPGPQSAASIAIVHSLRRRLCQTSATSRPLTRSARAMLLKAATGSEKNIVPNRLMATS